MSGVLARARSERDDVGGGGEASRKGGRCS